MAWWAKRVGVGLGALVALLCLAATLLPRYLDRIYYRGPVSDHFDGQRFFNPDGDDDRIVAPGGSRAGFIWRQATGSDGRPAWPDTVAVTPFKPPARVDGERMLVTWIGHATVLVQSNGINILTDPVYAERAGPFGLGPRRVAAPGVRFEDLPKIDLVLVSHNHYDHMDLGTLKRLWTRDRPAIVTSLGNGTILRKAGMQACEFDWGDGGWVRQMQAGSCATPTTSARPDIFVRVLRNHHWGSRWFADRNRALWSSFMVSLRGGRLYFAGDTGFGDGKWPEEARRAGPIRLALIPIGAFRFAPGQMQSGSHIGPIQAVEVFERLGARYGFPIHWGTFRLSYEGWDTPPKLLDRVMLCRGLHDFTAYPIGVPVEVPPIDAPRAELPAYPKPPGCSARPFAPDLK